MEIHRFSDYASSVNFDLKSSDFKAIVLRCLVSKQQNCVDAGGVL